MTFRRLLAVSVVLAAVAFPAAAQASDIVAPPDSRFPYQEWANESLVPIAPGVITVREEQGTCVEDQALACATPSTIYMVAASWISPYGGRHLFLHELGHIFDDRILTEEGRSKFETIIGDGGAWIWPDDGVQSPQEVFAEAYAFCALRPIWRIRGTPNMGISVSRTRGISACRWLRSL